MKLPILALTQSSKVLKKIDLFAFLALTHSWKVLKWIGLLLVSSMVLKEFALLTWCSVSWKETFFLPDLPMVLKEVSLLLFLFVSLTVDIILFCDDSYAIYTRGLERSQLVSVLLSSASSVFGWGLGRIFSAHLSDDSYALYTTGLETSQLVSILLSVALYFGWGLERSLSAGACSHGLERTGWMILKGLWCNSLVPQLSLAIYFQAMVLKGISGAGICLVFCGWNRLRNIFA